MKKIKKYNRLVLFYLVMIIVTFGVTKRLNRINTIEVNNDTIQETWVAYKR